MGNRHEKVLKNQEMVKRKARKKVVCKSILESGESKKKKETVSKESTNKRGEDI